MLSAVPAADPGRTDDADADSNALSHVSAVSFRPFAKLNVDEVIMDTRYLEYIVEIDKQRNITKAAKELYVSQSSLSQYLSKRDGRSPVHP